LRSPEARAVEPAKAIRINREYEAVLNHDALLTRIQGAKPGRGPSPAFLVGFPRSGTTMTEQILSAHPRIRSTDEIPIISQLKNELQAQARSVSPTDDRTALEILIESPVDVVDQWRTRYWQCAGFSEGAVDTSALFVDKLPLNLVDLPFVNVLFPEARILVALRDPRDVCLSCFQQDFGLNNAMANLITLEGTVNFYADVMFLYLRYRDRLTLRMIEVRYEDTVSDLEHEARRMLEFLGVPWDAGVLQFHDRARERVISTPSYEAVTRPIHTKAMHRWENYARHLAPYVDRLRPFIEAFGYSEKA
jgi:hypothetical protein